MGLQESKEIRAGTVVLEPEEFVWRKSAPISTDAFFTGLRVDAGTWVALLEERIVTREGQTFRTENFYGTSNLNDFGRPNRVVETADRSRTTDYTFDYNFSSSLYLKDRIASETISGGGKTFQKSFDYNNTTGFKESETLYGVTTTFSSDAFGNVDRITDATNKGEEVHFAARSLLDLREREGDSPESAPAFLRPPSPGMVDEDKSHRPGGGHAQVCVWRQSRVTGGKNS